MILVLKQIDQRITSWACSWEEGNLTQRVLPCAETFKSPVDFLSKTRQIFKRIPLSHVWSPPLRLYYSLLDSKKVYGLVYDKGSHRVQPELYSTLLSRYQMVWRLPFVFDVRQVCPFDPCFVGSNYSDPNHYLAVSQDSPKLTVESRPEHPRSFCR